VRAECETKEVVKSSPEASEDWRVVEEVLCPDGDNDRAIRDFNSRHRDLTAQPKRLRIEVLNQGGGVSTVRFLWNHATPEPTARRKPRSPKG
jgi:hypothetical protein